MFLKELIYLKIKLDRLYQHIQRLGYEQVQMHWREFKGWDRAAGEIICFSEKHF